MENLQIVMIGCVISGRGEIQISVIQLVESQHRGMLHVV
jgi:4-hydroxy-3-methylbut-2-en-1-yl diphosphate synthase IspG/GcpE